MGESPLILSVDTATPRGSVCLTSGGRTLVTIIGEASVSHSSTLLRDIDRVLKTACVSISEVGLFAAAAGPGSFTGLRIGLATIKALSATLDRPCVGVPTLQAVARAAGPAPATVALLPAGRGELFAQLLSVSSDGGVTELDSPAHLPAAAIISKYRSLPNVMWAGAGAHTHRDFLAEEAKLNGIGFYEGGADREGWKLTKGDESLAPHIAALAQFRFDTTSEVGAGALKAIYVRPSDPELKNVGN